MEHISAFAPDCDADTNGGDLLGAVRWTGWPSFINHSHECIPMSDNILIEFCRAPLNWVPGYILLICNARGFPREALVMGRYVSVCHQPAQISYGVLGPEARHRLKLDTALVISPDFPARSRQAGHISSVCQPTLGVALSGRPDNLSPLGGSSGSSTHGGGWNLCSGSSDKERGFATSGGPSGPVRSGLPQGEREFRTLHSDTPWCSSSSSGGT